MATLTVYVCKKCQYVTEKIREICPRCGGEMSREVTNVKIKEQGYTR